MIFLRQILRRDHNHRSVLAFLASPQRVHKLKPVHLWHHQVQQNKQRKTAIELFQSRLSILGLRHLPAILLQSAPQHFPHRGVVLYHQHPLWTCALPISFQDLVQPLKINRFGKIIRRAQGKAHLLVIDDGQHDHRDASGGWIGLQGLEHRPAIHAGHHHVQGDDGGLELLGQCDPGLAIPRDLDAESIFLQRSPHQIMHRRIIVNDQDGRG